MKKNLKVKRVAYWSCCLSMVMMFGLSNYVYAKDKIELDLVTVQGSREMPKVIYIVPWKRLKSNAKDQKLILHSLFKDAFDPIDPEIFEQRVQNYQQLMQ